MPPDVRVQVALFGAPEVAVGAHVRLFSRVRVDVLLQRHLLRRAELAVTAGVGPLAGVDPNVGLQVAEAAADLAAVGAHEGRRAVRRASGFLQRGQVVRELVPALGLQREPAGARHRCGIERVAGWER